MAVSHYIIVDGQLHTASAVFLQQ